MARSKSDISNSAIRIFLQKVGNFYDKERGFEVFRPSMSQKKELLEYFNSKCCYCGRRLSVSTLSQDHLIPMNKEYLGLHAWGNVVPCCTNCNNERQQRDWKEFLYSKEDSDVRQVRKRKIEKFIKDKKYSPNLHLSDFASNLYNDVGEVAMTLINLRITQAEAAIQRIVDRE